MHILRAPILNPRPDRSVQFLPDAALVGDDDGRIAFVGPWEQFAAAHRPDAVAKVEGAVLVPAFFDNHTHIPQHPIRGRFLEGVGDDSPSGRLLAGLQRNVFPAEARCGDAAYAETVIRAFLEDALRQGVVGGCAFMTVHADATLAALETLPGTWHVGQVLMNRNCPEYLRSDEPNLERDLRSLAGDFGRRFVLTDRFAVTADSALRRRALQALEGLDLIAQTHLNEQLAEKQFVERTLHPEAASYTDVYRRDGLLDRFTILAHCVHMRDDELAILGAHGCAVAHCPTSNALLGSGVMPLDRILDGGIDYALCTDVGASPTTSLLAEMRQFLLAHHGRSRRATPSEALYRITLGPARMLGLGERFGSMEPGKTLTYCEVAWDAPSSGDVTSAAQEVDAVILQALLGTTPAQLASVGAALAPAYDRLSQGEAPHSSLVADILQSARSLEQRVRRVVVAGTPLT